MIARLVRSVDFERALRTRTRANSAHFAVHHVADLPQRPAKTAPKPNPAELSTDELCVIEVPVDDSPNAEPGKRDLEPGQCWLGTVVPKRHARRAVTRTLLKRQIHAVVDRHGRSLGGGLWVIRLRAPFDRTRFPSAASDALRCAAREELEMLIGNVAQRAAVP